MKTMQLIDLIGVDELEANTPTKVEQDGKEFAVYRVEDEIYVTDDRCTHGPGSLSEGCLTGYEIECDFHQGCFDIRTGAVTVAPCTIPLRVYPVVIRDGRVFIES